MMYENWLTVWRKQNWISIPLQRKKDTPQRIKDQIVKDNSMKLRLTKGYRGEKFMASTASNGGSVSTKGYDGES